MIRIAQLCCRVEEVSYLGLDFIGIAMAIYESNDQRALVKKEINKLLLSQIVEEKHYET